MTVPGNASGHFGNVADLIVPFVPAISVNGPSSITVTYVSGTVTDCCGINTGPNGVPWPTHGTQSPIEEAWALSGGTEPRLDALIGVFVSQRRMNRPGFQAVDGTKSIATAGIAPDLLFFIGEGTTIQTTEAGTLYLGINDNWVSDNGGAFVVSVSATTQPYDAAAQFSARANPNGTWSYGWSETRDSGFKLDTHTLTFDGLDAWASECCGASGGSTGLPSVFHNGTSTTITTASATILAGEIDFHPGPHGQNAVVRWTAPAKGNYSVKVTFSGLDFIGPTTTDVAVLHNGGQLYASNINGYGSSSDESFTATVSIAEGDTIDFTVGYGTNGTNTYDSTGLVAVITPE